jgi:hypothetical protein
MEIPKQEEGAQPKETLIADGYVELKENKNQTVLLVKDILSENDKLAEIIKGDLKLDPGFKDTKHTELGGLRMEVQETLDNLKFAMADKKEEKVA